MISFAFRGTVADLDETIEDDPYHPATVLIVTCTVLAVMFLRRAGARTEGQARVGPKAARSI